MSWDYASQSHVCGHQQILERYVLDVFDFRTLHYAGTPTYNMRAPINGASLVQIYLKGVLCPPNDPLYGYSVVPDPDRIQIDPTTGVTFAFQKIVFNNPIRIVAPFYEVNYTTRINFCIQCGGFGNVIDWQPANGGSLIHVTDVTKLVQFCLKFILTSKNPFSPALICQLRNFVGEKFGLSVTTSDIANAITSALLTYQSIQGAQKTVQTLSPEETLKDVTSVVATMDDNNPLLVYVTAVVTAYGATNPLPINVALQTS